MHEYVHVFKSHNSNALTYSLHLDVRARLAQKQSWSPSHKRTAFRRWGWQSVLVERRQSLGFLQNVRHRHLPSLNGLSHRCHRRPSSKDGSSSFPEGHESVTFVGRPFPLEEAHEHLSRLRRWGLTFGE